MVFCNGYYSNSFPNEVDQMKFRTQIGFLTALYIRKLIINFNVISFRRGKVLH